MVGGGEGVSVDISGLSMAGHSYSGIQGYSDMEQEGGGHPWTEDGHGYCGIQGYTLTWSRGGWTSLDYPWMVRITLASTNTLIWGWWTSLDWSQTG